jgi:sugar phosphate isomerase/epimerase
MECGINVLFFSGALGVKGAAEAVSKAGFTKLDYTPHLGNDNWESQMKSELEIFKEYGLKVHQTHAPFNRYGSWGDNFGEYLERCAYATEFLGAEFMVAHGDEFDFKKMEFTPEAAMEYNRKIYLPYVERAKKNGYKVAFETVFDDCGLRRYTSRLDELYSFIKSFDSESAVCCWDFGHANVCFKRKAPEAIEKLGSLIQCTHLHDNGGNDSHQIPMSGDIDWKATMTALKNTGFNGVMSIEYAHGYMPADIAKNYIQLSYDVTKYLSELV